MMRVGLYRPVHVKTLRSQKLRMLLTYRKLLQSKAIAIENDLRGTFRNFGLKLGMVGTMKFESRIKELIANLPDLSDLIEPLLIARQFDSTRCESATISTHEHPRSLGGTRSQPLSRDEARPRYQQRRPRFGKVQLTAFRRVGNIERSWDAAFHPFYKTPNA
jgi:hypothetical protein